MSAVVTEMWDPGRVMGRMERDGFVEAATMMRQAIDRVLDLDDLTPGEAKVFLVVLRDVVSWSRVWDRTTRTRIARTARVSLSTVSRAMSRLTEVGALGWLPSNNPGQPSVVIVGGDEESSEQETLPEPMSPNDRTPLSSRDSHGRGVDRGDKEEGARSAGEDDLEAGEYLVAQAAMTLGCEAREWQAQPASVLRDAAEVAGRLIAAGVPHTEIYGVLVSTGPPREVRSWASLLIARMRSLGGVGFPARRVS